MIGAIIGDIVGSRFEWNNYLSKDFEFFHSDCRYTDDTVMTCAIANALINDISFIKSMQQLGNKYAIGEYGINFSDWLLSSNPQPYNSCGNGAAMKVSPIGFYSTSLNQVKEISNAVTKISHNHIEGLKGAEATAIAVYLANHNCDKKQIFTNMKNYYKFNKRVSDYRNISNGHGEEICQISVPQALICFFEGHNYEDVIRNCISIGGDSDTIAAIAGGIAEAYYGVPIRFINQAFQYLPGELVDIIKNFYKAVFNLNLIDI